MAFGFREPRVVTHTLNVGVRKERQRYVGDSARRKPALLFIAALYVLTAIGCALAICRYDP